MLLFATDTVNSKNYEAEASLELPSTYGAPFYFKVFQSSPYNKLPIQVEGAKLYTGTPTKHNTLEEETLFTEYAFIPTSNGFVKADICGEKAQISWETTDQEGIFLLKDFHGNKASFNIRTWGIKEMLSRQQIAHSDSITMVQGKLKEYVRNNGFNSQDPTLLNILGALCQLHQHS